MAFSFEPGKQYADRIGVYEVVSVSGARMRIRYENGTERDQTVETKARIHQNMVAEGKAIHSSDSPGYFRFVGYLARYGRLDAEVPESARSNFRHRYQQATGDDPEGQSGYSTIATVDANDKWGAELRIYFPEHSSAAFDYPEGVQPRAGVKEGEPRINNNTYWHRLVHGGFRLGRVQDKDRIREAVPHQHRTAFDEGYEL